MDNDIILLIDSRNIGGIETHVLNLAETLKNMSIPVRILLYEEYGNHPLIQQAKNKGLAITLLDGNVLSLYKYLRKKRPKLLHTHGYKAGILGRFIAKLLKLPIVSTYHAGEPGIGKLRLYTLFDRYTSFMSTNIAVSKTVAKGLPAKSIIINNFINLPIEQEQALTISNDGRLAVGFVGRMSFEKGPDLFIQLAGLHPEADFHMFGNGPMLKDIQQHKLVNVSLWGETIDMTKCWSRINLLCISSRFEGLPLVALEAMSHKIPVMAFAVGGLTDLIDNCLNGYLVEPLDVLGLSQCLYGYIDLNESRRIALHDQAYKTITERYTCNSLVPEVISVYEKALHEKSKAMKC